MKGYVENIGMAPMYILKGVVGKGEKIGFDVLLKRFGSEADTSSAAAFGAWLSKNRFSPDRWRIVVEPEIEPEIEPKIEPKKEETKVEIKEEKPISKVTATNREIITRSVNGIAKEITIDDIIDLKVPELKTLDRIKDEKLLRAALKKAERMTKKATLCNKLRDKLLEFDLR